MTDWAPSDNRSFMNDAQMVMSLVPARTSETMEKRDFKDILGTALRKGWAESNPGKSMHEKKCKRPIHPMS